jgi:hypothetical protein
VEKVAWLWRIVRIHGFHELLQDIQGGESTDALRQGRASGGFGPSSPDWSTGKRGSDHLRSEREACIDCCFTLKCAPSQVMKDENDFQQQMGRVMSVKKQKTQLDILFPRRGSASRHGKRGSGHIDAYIGELLSSRA